MGQYDDNVWKSKCTCPINPDKLSRDSTNRLNMEVSKATYTKIRVRKKSDESSNENDMAGMRWTHNVHGVVRICRKFDSEP